MTRAIDRLIVSGSVDVEAQRDTPIGWVLAQPECADELADAPQRVELERAGATCLVRVDRRGETAPAVVEEAVAEEGQLSLFAELPNAPAPRGYVLPELGPVPAPPIPR